MRRSTGVEERGAPDLEIGPMRRRHLRSVMRIESRVYPVPWSMSLFLSELALRSTRAYYVAFVGRQLVGYGENGLAGLGVGVRDADARPDTDPAQAVVRLRLYPDPPRDVFTAGHAWQQFLQRYTPPALDGLTILSYRMELVGAFGGNSRPLDVGFALVRQEGGMVRWYTDHFFVPPALMGGGIIGRMLDALIAHYRTVSHINRLEVVFGATADGSRPRGRAATNERVKLMEFFKSRGFRPQPEDDATPGRVTLNMDFRI